MTGRPTDYTPELGALICDRLLEPDGARAVTSLRRVCEAADVPGRSTVMHWLVRGERGEEPFVGFLALYNVAREMQAELLAEEIAEIADTPQIGVVETDKFDKDGKPITEVRRADMIEHRKLRISTRQWNAEKLRPKKYGAKVELGGNVGLTVVEIADFGPPPS